MALERFFGKKIENRNIDFDTALLTIEELKQNGAFPVEYRLELRVATHVRKNPDYDYVFGTLRTHLAPYQYEHNPDLRGETGVRYVTRDFSSEQTHTFYFEQTFDNLFKKGLSGNKAKLTLKLDKKQ